MCKKCRRKEYPNVKAFYEDYLHKLVEGKKHRIMFLKFLTDLNGRKKICQTEGNNLRHILLSFVKLQNLDDVEI